MFELTVDIFVYPLLKILKNYQLFQLLSLKQNVQMMS